LWKLTGNTSEPDFVAGQVELWVEDLEKQNAVMFEKMKAEAQAQLDQPNLSPDMRKMYEFQVASVYVALWVYDTSLDIKTFLTIVELKPMEIGLVTVNAASLASDITRTGHASVYGIHFDTGKADVKPESGATLKESPNCFNRLQAQALRCRPHRQCRIARQQHGPLQAPRRCSRHDVDHRIQHSSMPQRAGRRPDGSGGLK
jgi:hypothetical protein